MRVLCFLLPVIALVAAECPSGWPHVSSSAGVTCMMAFQGSYISWSEAQTRCRYDGGRLVTLKNNEELIFLTGIRATFFTDKDEDFWIGGKKFGNDWFWMEDNNYTDRMMTNTNWNSGQPDGGSGLCATLWRETSSRTRWDDMPCSYEKNYICEKRI